MDKGHREHTAPSSADRWINLPAGKTTGSRNCLAASGHPAQWALDALLADDESMAGGVFVDVSTDLEPTAVVPADWNPTERTLN